MSEFWDKRYSENGFAYGKEPNRFFKNKLDKLTPGKLLMIGEGEGRNAVYAASGGWEVDAVDFSAAAREKAIMLADEAGVKINYTVQDFNSFHPSENIYDAIGIIFVHLEADLRSRLFNELIASLKPGGRIILEAFEKDQINKTSGGPKDSELLNSLEDIATDFNELDFELFSKETVPLDEGKYHRGDAVVIRLLAQKPSE